MAVSRTIHSREILPQRPCLRRCALSGSAGSKSPRRLGLTVARAHPFWATHLENCLEVAYARERGVVDWLSTTGHEPRSCRRDARLSTRVSRARAGTFGVSHQVRGRPGSVRSGVLCGVCAACSGVVNGPRRSPRLEASTRRNMTTKRTPTATRRTKATTGGARPARKRQSKADSLPTPTHAGAESPSSQTAQHPRHEDVAFAAYTRYLGRQGAPGSDFDDWLQAERELLERSALRSAQG